MPIVTVIQPTITEEKSTMIRCAAYCRVSSEESAPEGKPAEKKVTLAEVKGLLAEISQSGRTSDVKKLISKYGGNKLSDIKEEQLGRLYKDAEVLKNAAD